MSTLVPCTNPRCDVRAHVPGSGAEIECRRVVAAAGAGSSDLVTVASATGTTAVLARPAVEFLGVEVMRTRLDDGDGAGVTVESQQVMDRHRHDIDAWSNRLSAQEKEMVRQYSLTYYYGTNDSLRAGLQNPIVAHLDSALSKVETGVQHVLYRGISFDEVDATEFIGENFAVGDEVTFPEYLSTSHCPQVASDFAMRGGDGFLFEILTDKGAAVQSQVGNNEFERLLPRDMRFRVVGIRDDIEIETDTSSGSETFPVVQLVEIMAPRLD